jgi:hypothetical protein
MNFPGSSQGRANHGGVGAYNATKTFNGLDWTTYSQAAPNYMDTTMSLDFWFPLLDVGASATFPWVYAVEKVAITDTALGNVSTSLNNSRVCSVKHVLTLGVTFATVWSV